MRSKTTSNRAIHPGDGWRQRMVFSVTMLFVMLLMPMASMAATYTFWCNNATTPLGTNGTFTNSSGDVMTAISGYDNRFGVTGNVGDTKNCWMLYKDNTLYNGNTGGKIFSIRNLQQGQKVKINWTQGSGTSNGNAWTSNLTFRTSGQADGKNAGDVVPNGQEFFVCGGTLDIDFGRYAKVSSIEINNSQWVNTVTFNTNSALGYKKWDASQKKMVDTNSSDPDGLPYYRVRLSARSFTEPTYTVANSGQISSWTIENYGPSAPANYDPKTGSGNKKVAVRLADNNMANCDVMFINEGWCKVTASCNGYTASYLVECWDNEANYELQNDGSKYIFVQNDSLAQLGLTGEQGGVLGNRVITAVPGIEVKIGIPEMDEGDSPGTDNSNADKHHQPHTAVVQRYPLNGTDHYVVWLNDDQGWWDRYPNNDGSWPQQGSFYTFTATADGVLKFGGIKDVRNGQNGSVYLVNLDNVNDRKTVSDQNQSTGYYESPTEGLRLTAGQRYCLHGQATWGYWDGNQNQWINEQHWAPYFLEWFSFEPDFALTEYYGVAAYSGYEIANENKPCESKQVIKGAGAAGWSASVIAYKGTVTSATANINAGKVVLTNLAFNTSAEDKMGGAVKVRFSKGNQYVDFVMTIPYGKHVWDFRQTANQDRANSVRFKPGDYSYTPAELVTMMNANGTDWSRVYKVRHRENGRWVMLISPILSARGSVIGNNAFYMDNTNGLVFLTDAESFGAEETSNQYGSEYEKDHGLAGIDDDVEFDFPYTTVTGADKVWMKGNNSSLLFPGVKPGQYIKIYTYRHSDDRGETFKAKNLVDLDNVAYDYDTKFLMRGLANGSVSLATKGDNMRGCAIFRVPSNYQPTSDPDKIPCITLCDIGWTQIFRIEIMDEFEPDLLLTVDTDPTEEGVNYVPVEYDAVTSSILIRDSKAEEREYLAISAYTGCQNANTCEYKVYPDAGVTVGVTRSVWTSGGGVPYNMMKLKYNSGNGLVRLVQREKAATDLEKRNTVTTDEAGAAGYVIDKNEYYIAVGELTAQTYPYTWDFSTYNLYQNESETKGNLSATSQGEYGDWDAIENNEDGFGQHDKEVIDFGTGSFDKTGAAKDNIAQVAEITRPLFAQGAQLASGEVTGTALAQNLIIEAEGLGVRRPYGDVKQFPYLYSEKVDNVTIYHEGQRPYDTYDLEDGVDGGISFDGAVLSGVGEITIPDVTNGMYVFVESSAAPTKVTINGTAVQPIEKFDKYATDSDIPAGVYAYLNNGNKADVVLNFAKTTGIVKIGVTNIHKEVNELGYASESRDHAIDHTYTGQFTTSDVDAFGVTIYDKETIPYNYQGYNEVRKTEGQVTVIPANTGCVLYGAETQGRRYEFPLFYPACNVIPTEEDCAFLKTNWMAPNVEATVHSSETVTAGAAIGNNTFYGWDSTDNTDCTKFLMTRKYFTYHRDGTIDTGEGEYKTSEVEAFYRLMISGDATKDKIGANKAYLLVPSEYLEDAVWNGGTGGYINMFYLDLEGYVDGGELNGIATVDLTDADDNSVYYTLTGIRLNGKPTVKGVYVCNGKKVYVK